MPSPIAHVATGYVVYRLARRGSDEPPALLHPRLPIPALLVATIFLSLAPDLDSALGLLLGDFGRYHNNLSHSLAFGVLVALAAGGLAHFLGAGFGRGFGLALVCYELHVVMDYFTWGRGVMILWPASPERYSPPLLLFHGVHWSKGWLTWSHLWTVGSELVLVGSGGFLIRALLARPSRSREESGG